MMKILKKLYNKFTIIRLIYNLYQNKYFDIMPIINTIKINKNILHPTLKNAFLYSVSI